MFPHVPVNEPMSEVALFIVQMMWVILLSKLVLLAVVAALCYLVWRYSRIAAAERVASDELHRDTKALLDVVKEYAHLGADRREDAAVIAEQFGMAAERAATVARVEAEAVKLAVAEVPDRVVEKMQDSTNSGTLKIVQPKPGVGE